MRKFNNILKLIYLSLVPLLSQQNIFAQNGWQLIHSFGREVGCIAFKDSLNGFVAAKLEPIIYKTTDGGITWNILNISNLENKITKIIFVDNNLIIGVGRKGTIIKSIDGGDTWEVKSTGDNLDLRSVCSTENGNIFACQWGGSKIYKSTDGGESWTLPSLEGFVSYFIDIDFADNYTGYCVGSNVAKTTDGGDTWFTIQSPARQDFYSIEFVNENVGYILV